MAFEIDFTRPLSAELLRVLAERIHIAAHTLETDAADSPDEAIHTARKRLKEARAVLRLVRRPLGRSLYRRANRALRDAARPLSEVRDAHVLVETLDKLIEQYQGEIEGHPFARLRRGLSDRRDAVRAQVTRDGIVFGDVARRARTVAAARVFWPALPDRWKPLGQGIERIYGGGQRAMARALTRRSDADRHEWRKRAKDLRHVFEVLSPLWKTVLEPMVKQAHELTDLLGDDHDLAVLAGLAQGDLHADLDDAALARLLALVKRRRSELIQSAADLGGHLYAEPASVLVKRMRAHWRTQLRPDAKKPAGEVPAGDAA